MELQTKKDGKKQGKNVFSALDGFHVLDDLTTQYMSMGLGIPLLHLPWATVYRCQSGTMSSKWFPSGLSAQGFTSRYAALHGPVCITLVCPQNEAPHLQLVVLSKRHLLPFRVMLSGAQIQGRDNYLFIHPLNGCPIIARTDVEFCLGFRDAELMSGADAVGSIVSFVSSLGVVPSISIVLDLALAQKQPHGLKNILIQLKKRVAGGNLSIEPDVEPPHDSDFSVPGVSEDRSSLFFSVGSDTGSEPYQQQRYEEKTRASFGEDDDDESMFSLSNLPDD